MAHYMVEYDPKVIQSYADACYTQADAEVRKQTMKWAVGSALALVVAAFVVASIAGQMFDWYSSSTNTLRLLGAGIGAVVGYTQGLEIGRNRGEFQVLHLRYEAQKALCLMRIRDNSDRLDPAAVRAVS